MTDGESVQRSDSGGPDGTARNASVLGSTEQACRPEPGENRELRIAVGIATVGRPAIVGEAVKELTNQIRRPDRIIVCAPSSDDLRDVDQRQDRVELFTTGRGLTRQRNFILERAKDCDVLIFFDDDFIPSPSYLAAIEATFLKYPDVVMGTGLLLADGILGVGLSWDAGRKLLCAGSEEKPSPEVVPTYSAYGCNMAVRLAPILAHAIEFDEQLPLYGWLEDVDFSRRLAECGSVVKIPAARGVHLGIKLAREKGRRLGYSQIANPLYLVRKGTYSRQRALLQISKNVAINLARALWPETYVDRRGRTSGNGLAMRDLLIGRLDPSRILYL